jgi:hypothetical protein
MLSCSIILKSFCGKAGRHLRTETPNGTERKLTAWVAVRPAASHPLEFGAPQGEPRISSLILLLRWRGLRPILLPFHPYDFFKVDALSGFVQLNLVLPYLFNLFLVVVQIPPP